MKKVLLSALAAGLIMVPLTNAEAYHIIKQHQEDPVVAARPVAEEAQSKPIATPSKVTPVVKATSSAKAPEVKAYQQAATNNNQGYSATATARTNRELISEEASEDVYRGSVKAVQAQEVVEAYHMRGGDVVQLMVYGHPEISTNPTNNTDYYKVRPDGGLSVPLIGEINCYGRTVADVVNEITQRLAEYIIDPKVSINITKFGTVRVHVLGQITRQGNFELEKGHRLIDALGAAGGFTEKSAKKHVYVVRQGLDHFVTKINVLEVLTKGNQECNPELQEGDIVYLSSNHRLGLASILSYAYNLINAADNIDEMDKRK